MSSVMEFHVCALCTCVDCRKVHIIVCVDYDWLKFNKKGGYHTFAFIGYQDVKHSTANAALMKTKVSVLNGSSSY